MDEAARHWATAAREADTSVVAVGYFGSYARGDWGVGSDLDVVILVEASDLPFERRAARFDATVLPVPVDLLVYTRPEWDNLPAHLREVVWLTGNP